MEICVHVLYTQMMDLCSFFLEKVNSEWQIILVTSFCLLKKYKIIYPSTLRFYCFVFGLSVFLVTKTQMLLNLQWFSEGGYLVFLKGQIPLSQTLYSYLPLTCDSLGHFYCLKNSSKRAIIQYTGHLRKKWSLQTNR